MCPVSDHLRRAREELQAAHQQAQARQQAATYELANGRFTPLIESTALATTTRLLLQQLDTLLRIHD